jgi:hypothetical protein
MARPQLRIEDTASRYGDNCEYNEEVVADSRQRAVLPRVLDVRLPSPHRMGAKRNAYRISVGKSEGKRPLGRPRRRWTNNIKMDLRKMEWYGLD